MPKTEPWKYGGVLHKEDECGLFTAQILYFLTCMARNKLNASMMASPASSFGLTAIEEVYTMMHIAIKSGVVGLGIEDDVLKQYILQVALAQKEGVKDAGALAFVESVRLTKSDKTNMN